MIAAVIAEIVSLMGNAHHTPKIGLDTKKLGRINAKGMRYSTCRVRLRKMDLPAIPMDVKKLTVTIWNPTRSMEQARMRVGRIVSETSWVSWVNILTMRSGTISPNRKTPPITKVAQMEVRYIARHIRRYCLAP